MPYQLACAILLISVASLVAGFVIARCWNRAQPTSAVALTGGLFIVALLAGWLVRLATPEISTVAAAPALHVSPESGVGVLPAAVIKNYDREVADTLRPTVLGNSLAAVRQLLYAPEVMVFEHVMVREDRASYFIICGRVNAMGTDGKFTGPRRFVLAPGHNLTEAETGLPGAATRTAQAWRRHCDLQTASDDAAQRGWATLQAESTR